MGRNKVSLKIKILAFSVLKTLLLLALTFSPTPLSAKTKSIRKVQEVNFSEMNLKGTIRNPDGAYLVQRKGLKFIPLHNLQKNMDQKIREADLYLR